MDVVSEDPFWHGRWDAGRLERQCLSSWDALAAAGVGVHVSEVACYKETPHEVMLAWYRDFLRAWKRRGWGWALWNLRGDFGVVDSGRSDVAYEDLDGHRLSGEHGGVDGRRAVLDDTVGGDLLPRTHDEPVPDRQLAHGHAHLCAVTEDGDVLGAHVEQGAQRRTGLALGAGPRSSGRR